MPIIPHVATTFADHGLGAVNLRTRDLPFIAGCCSLGTANVPTLFKGGSAAAIVAQFGYGPATQMAAMVSSAGFDLVFNRMASTNAGTQSAVATTGTGTSVVTLSGAALDFFDAQISVKSGGTIGVAGIVLNLSLDGGRTQEPPISLGTASTYVIPNTGVTLNFAAGTMVSLDTKTFQTVAPTWAAADITSAYVALLASLNMPDFAHIVGPMTSTLASGVVTQLAAAEGVSRFMSCICDAPLPALGVADATYVAAETADYAAFSNLRIGVGAGGEAVPSAIDARQYVRPSSWMCVLRGIANDCAVDAGEVDIGALPCSLYDANNNLLPYCHDEAKGTSGLDAGRFISLMTINNLIGVYVTNPNIMAPAGSDFSLWQYRRVCDKGASAAYASLVLALSKGVRTDPVTGFILEKDAAAIESACNSALKTVLLDTNRASRAYFVLNRTDNILSTKIVKGKTKIQPLGYIKEVDNDVSFINPALAAAS